MCHTPLAPKTRLRVSSPLSPEHQHSAGTFCWGPRPCRSFHCCPRPGARYSAHRATQWTQQLNELQCWPPGQPPEGTADPQRGGPLSPAHLLGPRAFSFPTALCSWGFCAHPVLGMESYLAVASTTGLPPLTPRADPTTPCWTPPGDTDSPLHSPLSPPPALGPECSLRAGAEPHWSPGH